MLQGLIAFCLRMRMIVLLLAVVLIVAGAVAVRDAPWDVFPEFAPPQIVVQTEAAGLSTEEVEQLVTLQIESALNGVSRIKTLRSSSVAGLSVVTAIFEDGTDVLDARQLVAERLSQVAPQLPARRCLATDDPLAASTSRLLMLGLTSDTASPMALRTLADWTFRRRLQAVQGVAHVEVFGGDVKQYQILVTPERLHQFHVTLADVQTAARNATGFGGRDFWKRRTSVCRFASGRRSSRWRIWPPYPSPSNRESRSRLGRLTDVQIGAADKPGDATINGNPAC